jgi:hypothetical protein
MGDHDIDAIMEDASRMLLATRYLECERLCLMALERARAADDFDRYARILMPLQEARRQRRQIATDAGVFVIAGQHRSAEDILMAHREGCLLLVSPPYSKSDLEHIRALADKQDKYIEAVLLTADAALRCFEYMMECGGDGALSKIDTTQPLVQQLDALAHVVDEVGDHEIAHQRLAEVARKLAAQQTRTV